MFDDPLIPSSSRWGAVSYRARDVSSCLIWQVFDALEHRAFHLAAGSTSYKNQLITDNAGLCEIFKLAMKFPNDRVRNLEWS